MKASDLMVRCLETEGIEYIFGVPGEENADFMMSLESSDSIRFILTRHEQGAAFMAEIASVAEDGVTEEEVARAKRQMEVSLINRFATNHSMASRLGREIVAFGRVRPLTARIEAIRAVTPEDVKRVVATYLTDAGRNVVRVLAPPVREELATNEGGAR